MFNKLLLTLFCFSLGYSSFYCNEPKDVFIGADSLSKYSYITLSSNWSFNPNDNPMFADTAFIHDDWKLLSTRLAPIDGIPDDWTGTGWFRRWIDVDSNLVGKVVGVSIWQTGALELYVNGNKYFSIGSVGSPENYSTELHRGPRAILFDKPGKNLLAIRYSNYEMEFFHNSTYLGGFILSLGDYQKLLKSSITFVRDRSVYQIFFISVPLAIAFVHLFMFLYDRRKKDNIYYVIFLISFSLFIYGNFQRNFVDDNYYAALLFRLNVFTLLASIYTGCLAVFSIMSSIPRYYIWLGYVGIILSILGYIIPGVAVWYASYGFIMFISVPTGHNLWKTRKNEMGGEWIIRTGFMFMSVMGFTNMLQSFDIVPAIFGITGLYVYGVLGFIISMSALLARDFFITSKSLETQLNTVKELSEKTLQQELQAKELETNKRILEADNQRKTQELEEARELQLSMLPQCLNDIPGYDICFDMRTATEVGGDYYDYIFAKDGTLHIAIGDATGHGTKAGLMVATVKSLFNSIGTNMMIQDFFARCTEILKKMNLGNLFMSMTLLRIKNKYLIASTAGMPPMMIYKKSQNRVDEHTLKGMPLGAFEGFEYSEMELELESGDVILLMSDGLIELFNEKMEMFGEKRIEELLKINHDKSSDEIVQIFYNEADKWSGDKPQDDDMTFIVIKILE
jgi:serine phosphatase RsbU (regulator of sigma subunit)